MDEAIDEVAKELRRLIKPGLSRRKLETLPRLMELGTSAQVETLIVETINRAGDPDSSVYKILLMFPRHGGLENEPGRNQRGRWKTAPGRREDVMMLVKYQFSPRDWYDKEEPRWFERLARLVLAASEDSIISQLSADLLIYGYSDGREEGSLPQLAVIRSRMGAEDDPLRLELRAEKEVAGILRMAREDAAASAMRLRRYRGFPILDDLGDYYEDPAEQLRTYVKALARRLYELERAARRETG